MGNKQNKTIQPPPLKNQNSAYEKLKNSNEILKKLQEKV